MKIVILDGHTANPGDLDWAGIAALGDLTVYDRTPEDQIIPRIGDHSIVLTNKTPITAHTLAACPGIRMICVLATGYNVVDIAAAKARHIPVCNIPAYSTAAVAQLTTALLLEICQQVGHYAAATRQGVWTKQPDFCYWDDPLTELDGKTLGIIGYGKIGQAFGRIAQAMGMKLLVSARHPQRALEGPSCRYASLAEIYAKADVISLHCPLTEQTQGMISAQAIAQMKDGVILLNTSRGPLVEEAALAQALREGKVRAAGVDVVAKEPIAADNPLLSAPNCYITPHIGWAPQETRQRLLGIAENNIRAFLAGAPINVVND